MEQRIGIIEKSINKMILKSAQRINTKCCTHYNGTNIYNIGYVMCPYIRVARCCDCNNIQLICGKFTEKIFEKFLSHFWNGKTFLLSQNIKIESIDNVKKSEQGKQ